MQPKFNNLLSIVVLLAVCSSCANETTKPVPFDPTPSVHRYPTWISEGVVGFQNTGAVSVGPGWLSINSENRGIVGFSLDTQDYEMLISNGIWPNSNLKGSKVVAHLIDPRGPVAIFQPEGSRLLKETKNWSRRSGVKINHDGTLFAWRSFGPDQEIGVWVYSEPTSEYTFLGQEAFISWHPFENTLIYRSFSDIGQLAIIENHLESGIIDTLLTFPSNFGSEEMSYSPDGEKIAFLGRGRTSDLKGIYTFEIGSKSYKKVISHWGLGLSWGPRGIVYNNDCGELEDPTCGVLWLLDPETGKSRPITERFQFDFSLSEPEK